MFDTEKIKRLAKIHGTPMYIYSRKRIENGCKIVRKTFPGFNIIYSVKANPFEPILLTLRDLGIGIDAASRNEVLSAARLGFDDIYYSAPGKIRRDIKMTLHSAQIIADSLNELRLINEIASMHGVVVDVGVRLNITNPTLQESRFEVMSGAASKFGIDLKVFIQSALEIKDMRGLCINGLHVYFGSQLMDAQLISENFTAISHAAMLAAEHFPITYINYGGGFGVPYEDHEKGQPNLSEAAESILTDENTHTLKNMGIRLNIELGRYLTAAAGIYVTAVADIKNSGGIRFVILDGGMNTFFRPKFTGQTHRVNVLDKSDAHEIENVRLVGNTCTPLDVFYEDIALPALNTGDLLIFENAGAYGYSMSLLDFISFDKPAQIMEEF